MNMAAQYLIVRRAAHKAVNRIAPAPVVVYEDADEYMTHRDRTRGRLIGLACSVASGAFMAWVLRMLI